jgi:hypothetical protein
VPLLVLLLFGAVGGALTGILVLLRLALGNVEEWLFPDCLFP